MASPTITAGPDAALVASILNRQNESPVTCGYVMGDANSPVTCAAGSTCTSNLSYEVHYCCADPDNCVMPWSCYPADGIADGLCNESCQENSSILKCTFSEYSYCYTRHWVNTPLLTGYGCATSPFFELVYSQTTDSPYTASYATSTAIATGDTSPKSTASSATSSSMTSSMTSSTTSSSHARSIIHLSAGAIVGIVLGAVVFLSILSLAFTWTKLRAWFLRRRSPQSNEPEPILLDFRTRPASTAFSGTVPGGSMMPGNTGPYENDDLSSSLGSAHHGGTSA